MNVKALIFLVLMTVSACSGDRNSDSKFGPTNLTMPVSAQSGMDFIGVDANLSSYTEGETVKRLSVRFKPVIASNATRHISEFGADPALVTRVAVSLKSGRDGSAALTLARIIARSTYCREGKIALNNAGRRYNQPEEISAIISNYKRTGSHRIPNGVVGKPILAVEYETNRLNGRGEWVVSMNCNSPTPYQPLTARTRRN